MILLVSIIRVIVFSSSLFINLIPIWFCSKHYGYKGDEKDKTHMPVAKSSGNNQGYGTQANNFTRNQCHV